MNDARLPGRHDASLDERNQCVRENGFTHRQVLSAVVESEAANPARGAPPAESSALLHHLDPQAELTQTGRR